MLKQRWAWFSPPRRRIDPDERVRRIATLFDELVLTTRANEQFPQQAQILNFGDGPRDGQLLLGVEGHVKLGPELGGAVPGARHLERRVGVAVRVVGHGRGADLGACAA